MNYNIVLYCKTFHRDFERVKRLLDSIQKYNVDNIPFYISTPHTEQRLLEQVIGTDGYEYIADETLYDIQKPIAGWEQQMLVKMGATFKLPTANILVIDSDSFFIKDFYESDFIAYGDVPYTIIHENKQVAEYEAALKGGTYNDTGYAKAVRAYRELFGVKSNRIYDYGPNPHLWSTKVFKHMQEHYLGPNKLTLETLSIAMKHQYNIHFREPLTYGEYLLATNCIPIIPSGPLFKVYHWREMYEFEQGTGLETVSNIKKNYLGIIMQSNWS